MIITLDEKASAGERDELYRFITESGYSFDRFSEEGITLIIVRNADAAFDADRIKAFPAVKSVKRITPAYKLARGEKISVKVGKTKIGGGNLTFIGGPCAIENEETLFETAKAVKKAGATVFRAGAYKPRTSPYSFQGLGADGLKMLAEVKAEVGLPTVSEIVDIRTLDLFAEVDMLQVGAKNMQNFELLKELGKCGKPVLLKRGFANTTEEFLMSAEYLLNAGNENVVLCERGIRTFENCTRFTLDVGAVAYLKNATKLPVIVDPSHAAGVKNLVEPLALAGIAAGAEGLICEVHSFPEKSLCDGAQAISPKTFSEIVKKAVSIGKIL